MRRRVPRSAWDDSVQKTILIVGGLVAVLAVGIALIVASFL